MQTSQKVTFRLLLKKETRKNRLPVTESGMICKKQQPLLIQKLIIQYRFIAVHFCNSNRTGSNYCFSNFYFLSVIWQLYEYILAKSILVAPHCFGCMELFCCMCKLNKLFVHSQILICEKCTLCCHLVGVSRVIYALSRSLSSKLFRMWEEKLESNLAGFCQIFS